MMATERSGCSRFRRSSSGSSSGSSGAGAMTGGCSRRRPAKAATNPMSEAATNPAAAPREGRLSGRWAIALSISPGQETPGPLDPPAPGRPGPAPPGGELAPQGQVARVLEVGDDPAGAHQLGVEPGQVPEGHADVDMVGEMPAGVVGHEQEAGQAPLADHVGGLAAGVGAGPAPVLGDGPGPGR